MMMNLHGRAPGVVQLLRRGGALGAGIPLTCSSAASCQCRSRRVLRTRAARGFGKLLEKDKKASKATHLTPHKVSPRLRVPGNIQKPQYVDTGEMPWGKEPAIHDAEGVERMRAACKLAAQVLQYAGTFVKPGVTTDFIDKKVHEMIIDNNAYPSPLTYGAAVAAFAGGLTCELLARLVLQYLCKPVLLIEGLELFRLELICRPAGNFPKSVCTSVNECVCHGIPDSRQLQEGDLVNIDVTVYLDGYHGDTSSMYFAGEPSQRSKWLSEINKETLYEAIKQCGPGVPFNTVGKTIEAIADRHKVKVCAEFVGHGVGRSFHCEPPVGATRNSERSTMQPNQTFTIEPIFVDGNPRWQMWKDGWTVVTKDKSWTAQHEHTILITESGHEVLTQL